MRRRTVAPPVQQHHFSVPAPARDSFDSALRRLAANDVEELDLSHALGEHSGGPAPGIPPPPPPEVIQDDGGEGDTAATALAAALRANRSLAKLSLRGNAVGAAGATALAGALRPLGPNSTLAELDLHGNAVGTAGVKALCEVVAHSTALRALDLGGNRLGQEAGVEDLGGAMHALYDAMKASPALASLRLGGNFLGAEAAEFVGNGMAEADGTLTDLDLCSNALTNAGALHLCSTMRRCYSLLHLRLARNHITCQGAIMLAGGVAHRGCALRTLDLDFNAIADRGAQVRSSPLLATDDYNGVLAFSLFHCFLAN